MPNYQAWDLVDEFTIYQASCLWCDVEPEISWMFTELTHPEVQAVSQFLQTAVRNGDLEANTDDVLAFSPDYHKAVVRRSDLIGIAESKDRRPLFLFPEDRSAAQPAGRDGVTTSTRPNPVEQAAKDKQIEVQVEQPEPPAPAESHIGETAELARPRQPGEANGEITVDEHPQRVRAERKHDQDEDADLRRRINGVLAKARSKWPKYDKRPSPEKMAKKLFREHGKDLGYKPETARKILAGNYRPAQRLGIGGIS